MLKGWCEAAQECKTLAAGVLSLLDQFIDGEGQDVEGLAVPAHELQRKLAEQVEALNSELWQTELDLPDALRTAPVPVVEDEAD